MENIVVSEEVKDIIDEASEQSGMSRKAIVENAVTWYLEQKHDYYFTESKKATLQKLREKLRIGD